MKAQYGGGTITTCNTQNQSKYCQMKVFKNLANHNRHIQNFHAKLLKNLGKIEIHKNKTANSTKKNPSTNIVYISISLLCCLLHNAKFQLSS
jgi:hypothetical protein